MKPTYEELEEQNAALRAQVRKLLASQPQPALPWVHGNWPVKQSPRA